MFHTEAHCLEPGQHFSFEDTPAHLVVDSTDVIGYEGQPLVCYREDSDPGLHAHLRDHTEVWVD